VAAPASHSLAKAVFLSVDSAAVSGVALSVPSSERRKSYEVDQFGECSRQHHREKWILEALEVAEDMKLPLVVVGEEWTAHGISSAAYASLCEGWGKWLAAIESAAAAYPGTNAHAHVVRVNPNVWRAAVLGKRRPKKSADLKRAAVQYAELALGMPPNLSDNIAEALCIRVWAERAAVVHELLKPKRRAA